MQSIIRYGKGNITFYRTYAQPLAELAPIPESAYTGRDNVLFAVDVDVEVFGDNFLPAYTEGDNANVVATDSMKNFVLKQALAYDGATLEGFLAMLGRQFLTLYPQMQSLRLTGREQPFEAALVPESDGFSTSRVLFARGHGDRATAVLEMDRAKDGTPRVTGHRCGRVDLQLIKITGSSFTSFLRDQHTTLPETVDRPLFIYLDVFWRYAKIDPVMESDSQSYVAAEQVADVVQVVFHQFNSKSIQHLVNEMGLRLLERFPQLAEVSFDAQNRLWDTTLVSNSDPTVKVYVDPRPPYGMIHLTLTRDASGDSAASAQGTR